MEKITIVQYQECQLLNPANEQLVISNFKIITNFNFGKILVIDGEIKQSIFMERDS